MSALIARIALVVADEDSALWERLWLNVLNFQTITPPGGNRNPHRFSMSPQINPGNLIPVVQLELNDSQSNRRAPFIELFTDSSLPNLWQNVIREFEGTQNPALPTNGLQQIITVNNRNITMTYQAPTNELLLIQFQSGIVDLRFRTM